MRGFDGPARLRDSRGGWLGFGGLFCFAAELGRLLLFDCFLSESLGFKGKAGSKVILGADWGSGFFADVGLLIRWFELDLKRAGFSAGWWLAW